MKMIQGHYFRFLYILEEQLSLFIHQVQLLYTKWFKKAKVKTVAENYDGLAAYLNIN